MFSEEIKMTVETAVKVRKHLLRKLQNNYEAKIAEQLIYVDNIINEANIIGQSEVVYE